MAQRKTDCDGPRTPAFVAAVAAVAALVMAVPVMAAAAPPENDNYLSSASLNSPGSRLDRTHTLKDVGRDTTAATVQNDIFSPPRSGGLREITSFSQCRNSTRGGLIRAHCLVRLLSDVSGLVRLQASGYDSVISVFEFNTRTFQPDYTTRQCINELSGTFEELFATVKKVSNSSYIVQSAV